MCVLYYSPGMSSMSLPMYAVLAGSLLCSTALRTDKDFEDLEIIEVDANALRVENHTNLSGARNNFVMDDERDSGDEIQPLVRAQTLPESRRKRLHVVLPLPERTSSSPSVPSTQSHGTPSSSVSPKDGLPSPRQSGRTIRRKTQKPSPKGTRAYMVCEWLEFFFRSRLRLEPDRKSIHQQFIANGLILEDEDRYHVPIDVILISGAIAKLWGIRNSDWSDLDLWLPNMATWKPFLAKPVAGEDVEENFNQLRLPHPKQKGYSIYAEQIFFTVNGSRLQPPEDMPEVDSWDPVNEPTKLITPDVYQHFKRFRFEIPCHDLNYLMVWQETPAGQVAFKIGMMSGGRQDEDGPENDPFRLLEAGTLANPFRYKPTDLTDLTGALFAMVLQLESYDHDLWDSWKDRRIYNIRDDDPRRKWYRVYYDRHDIFYFTPSKGHLKGTIYRATFVQWFGALVPHFDGKDFCRIGDELSILMDDEVCKYITSEEMIDFFTNEWVPTAKEGVLDRFIVPHEEIENRIKKMTRKQREQLLAIVPPDQRHQLRVVLLREMSHKEREDLMKNLPHLEREDLMKNLPHEEREHLSAILQA